MSAVSVATPAPAVTVYRDTTPSGIVVEYCPDPRWYKVNGKEVPSVTTVLDVLRKDGLAHWGAKVAVEGVLSLFQGLHMEQVINWNKDGQRNLVVYKGGDADQPPDQILATTDVVMEALKTQKLTPYYALSRAGDRGTNVHSALEAWAQSGGEFFPTPQNFPEEERPYVEGLLKWIDAVDGAANVVGVETMVGSAEHGYAGRFDLTIELWEAREFIRKAYKRKESPTVKVEPGRYLVDLKTSSGVYQSHHLQLAAYELASVECDYEATDGQFVLHLTKDGAYEFVPSVATGAQFLAVKQAYDALKGLK
jgi:hypothetical protein